MQRRSWFVVSLAMAAGLGLALVAAPVSAQPASAQAEQLFREGKRLMGEGKLADACRAFEGSYRKDEVVTTLLNLADCREKNGQLASAWGHFLDAERMTRSDAAQATFNRTARDRAGKLEARLSYLIINVPASANVDGLAITRNGVPVDEAEWNTDIPVDGGEYVVEGKAPGYEAWSTRVTVGAERDKQSVNVPRFRERPRADEPLRDGGAGAGAAGAADGGAASAGTGGDDRGGGSGRKTAGVVTLAGGGALVLGGLALGYLAQQKWSEAKDLCGDDLICDSAADHMAGQALVDAARFRGNVSTVVTASGVVAIGAGVVLWLTAPRSERRATSVTLSPVVRADGVGVVIGGAL